MKKNGDNNTEVNKGGRPSLWVNSEVLEKLINEYFENEKQPTLAGLAFSLGISRATLYNYEQKDEFLDIIKKARERVEKYYEKHLIYGDKPTGVIFALKNMGWKDRIEQENTGEIKHTISDEQLKRILGGSQGENKPSDKSGKK